MRAAEAMTSSIAHVPRRAIEPVDVALGLPGEGEVEARAVEVGVGLVHRDDDHALMCTQGGTHALAQVSSDDQGPATSMVSTTRPRSHSGASALTSLRRSSHVRDEATVEARRAAHSSLDDAHRRVDEGLARLRRGR